MKNKLLFQKAAIAICLLFGGLMVWVAVVAFLRPSGNTGIDSYHIQMIRAEQFKTKLTSSEKVKDKL